MIATLLRSFARVVAPYGLPIALALLTASHLWAYRAGVTRQTDRQARADLTAVQRAIADHDALQTDLDTIATRALTQTAARAATTRTITHEVIRYVARTPDTDCWDADSLRLVRAAARGEPPADPGQPAATLPAPP